MMNVACLVHLLAVLFAGYSWGQNVNCTVGELRLYNSSAPGQGMLQICTSPNQWTAVCGIYFDCSDSKVACQQLGYEHSRPSVLPDGYFGMWDSMLDYYYSCSTSDETLQDCKMIPTPSCNITKNPNRMAAIACHPPFENCTHGDLRLVGGESESEGRVEVCSQGGWYSVCGTEDEEASVMCKQLGYTSYPWAAVFIDDERFGKTPPSQGYMRFECSEQFTESNWTECNIENKCDHCRGDAIKCFDPPECEEGSIRLAGGTIDNEGRVEICLKGVWGTVLGSSNWEPIDAYIACKQTDLGTSGKEPVVYNSSSEFGDGKQPQVMFAPKCSGWESTLTDCSYIPYGEFDFSRSITAGAFCFDDCKDGEIRLVGGASKSEGTVEVCLGNLWGLVEDPGWSHADAQVACKQVGFPTDDVQVVRNSQYGKPRKPVHFRSVNCAGNEQHILSCAMVKIDSMEEKKAKLNQVEVAGVLCQVQGSTENPTTQIPTNSSTSFESSSQTSTAYIIVPSLLCALLLAVVIGLIILILMMYRKKKPAPSIDTSDITKQPLQNNSLPSRYEMGGRGPRPPIPTTSPPVQTTTMGEENDGSGPLYECPDPLEDYVEMS